MELTDEQKEYMEKVGCAWGINGSRVCGPRMPSCCVCRHRSAAALARAMACSTVPTLSHPLPSAHPHCSSTPRRRSGRAPRARARARRGAPACSMERPRPTTRVGSWAWLGWLLLLVALGSVPKNQAQPGWLGRCSLGSCAASHALLTLPTHLPALVTSAGRSWLECPKERSKREVGSQGVVRCWACSLVPHLLRCTCGICRAACMHQGRLLTNDCCCTPPTGGCMLPAQAPHPHLERAHQGRQRDTVRQGLRTSRAAGQAALWAAEGRHAAASCCPCSRSSLRPVLFSPHLLHLPIPSPPCPPPSPQQLLPGDGPPAAVCGPGRQHQDLGRQRAQEVHAHVHGTHQGGRALCWQFQFCAEGQSCRAVFEFWQPLFSTLAAPRLKRHPLPAHRRASRTFGSPTTAAALCPRATTRRSGTGTRRRGPSSSEGRAGGLHRPGGLLNCAASQQPAAGRPGACRLGCPMGCGGVMLRPSCKQPPNFAWHVPLPVTPAAPWARARCRTACGCTPRSSTWCWRALRYSRAGAHEEDWQQAGGWCSDATASLEAGAALLNSMHTAGRTPPLHPSPERRRRRSCSGTSTPATWCR